MVPVSYTHLLHSHDFQSSLNNQIAIGADVLHAGVDLVQDGVGSSLIHLALGDALLQTSSDLLLAVGGKLLVDVAQINFVALSLSKGCLLYTSRCV